MSLIEFLRRRPARPNPGSGITGVTRVVDTRAFRGIIQGIGEIGDDGVLTTFHVSDAPEDLLAALRRRVDLVASYGPKGRQAELGPGLYLTGSPYFWLSRSNKKWSFLEGIAPDALARLLDALDLEVDRQREEGRVSSSEWEWAKKAIQRTRDGMYTPGVMLPSLAGPPLGIPFWRASFLTPLGIKTGIPPRVLELRVVGRFAELPRAYPPYEFLRLLRRSGMQGVFNLPGMNTNPELVLWDARAVVGAREI